MIERDFIRQNRCNLFTAEAVKKIEEKINNLDSSIQKELDFSKDEKEEIL